MNRNLSYQGPKPINGFPRFADAITKDPDRTGTIYRRFNRLSSRNLLLMEAEIAELEALQDKYDEDDRAKHDYDIGESYSKWATFEKLAEEKDRNGNPLHSRVHERMQLSLLIKEKLEKYRAFVLITRRAGQTPASPELGEAGAHHRKGYEDAQRFDDVDDLVALKVLANQDRLSKFVLNHCGWLFEKHQRHGTSVVISERSLDKATTLLSSVLSAVVLFGSIVSLYFVQNPYALLGMVGGWTILFAVCVGVLTNAKRDQIFASTAAFAAVLVVIVGESLNTGPGPGVKIGATYA
ncbi:hypothetical protein PG993_013854 [Apiospora rasikravindrae]|uniref:DUF6594 domain-containing protein n=1 Tax=Apiospora rasikravindrae TaxID=990691 RepID=A0ABR1RRI0_9PEZI